jgi:hypothetical protein
MIECPIFLHEEDQVLKFFKTSLARLTRLRLARAGLGFARMTGLRFARVTGLRLASRVSRLARVTGLRLASRVSRLARVTRLVMLAGLIRCSNNSNGERQRTKPSKKHCRQLGSFLCERKKVWRLAAF